MYFTNAEDSRKGNFSVPSIRRFYDHGCKITELFVCNMTPPKNCVYFRSIKVCNLQTGHNFCDFSVASCVFLIVEKLLIGQIRSSSWSSSWCSSSSIQSDARQCRIIYCMWMNELKWNEMKKSEYLISGLTFIFLTEIITVMDFLKI